MSIYRHRFDLKKLLRLYMSNYYKDNVQPRYSVEKSYFSFIDTGHEYFDVLNFP